MEENTVPVEQTIVETESERNFKVMREKYMASERRIKEMEQERQQAQSAAPVATSDDYDPYDDTFIDRKTLKKEKQETERALKEVRDELAKVNNLTADMKLAAKYNDFYTIVNPENLEKLSILKPSHYRAVASTNDYYAAGETAYDLIKAFVEPSKTAAVDKKLEENRSKPRSSGGAESYVSNSPLTMAQDYDRRTLTPDRKAQLRRQVAELKKFS